jgi:hypothetical protein
VALARSFGKPDGVMKTMVVLPPVFFTFFLLVWWALAEKYSYYGSWHTVSGRST